MIVASGRHRGSSLLRRLSLCRLTRVREETNLRCVNAKSMASRYQEDGLGRSRLAAALPVLLSTGYFVGR